MPRQRLSVAIVAALALAGCGERAKLDVAAGTGPNPTLPEPNKTLFPTMNIAKAVGWPAGATPAAAPGLAVAPYATGLDHPRWLLVLPNGDVLVAESQAPPKKESGGIRSWVQKLVMKQAGSGAKPSANRITLLRDTDGDGRADVRSAFLTGLFSPVGMALVGDTLYVANADALVKVPYVAGETKIAAKPVKVVDLPGGPINHHWTKTVVASEDGKLLYVAVGSNSNVGERGPEAEDGRASIWEIDAATGQHRVFAAGLRNPVGMAWEPGTRQLWTVVNERDEIGSDLVPDYLTHVEFGGFYGWPWVYYGNHVDKRVEYPRPPVLEEAIKPDYALGPHTASLGLSFAAGQTLSPRFANGAFIGQHGSWNREPASGYKVVFVPFASGKPTAAKPVDVLSGFLNKDGEAQGRPVGVALDKAGALLVADDVGNAVWRVTGAPAASKVAQR